MDSISAVGAIIVKDGKILAAQRSYGSGGTAGGWEFPGGKIEPGETPEQAVVREVAEELGVEVAVDRYFTTAEHDYDDFHLDMRCYLCHIVSGEVELREHADARWLSSDAIDSVAWLPADIQVIEKIKRKGITG